MPVDTSVHEGLHEPQDPSGLRSNLALGPAWPEAPPGLRAHLASGPTWPRGPPGLRFHLAPGSTWPQVTPGHRLHLASGSTWPQVPSGLRFHLASGSTWPQVPSGLRFHGRSCHSTQTCITCQGFTEVILQGSVNYNVFTALTKRPISSTLQCLPRVLQSWICKGL